MTVVQAWPARGPYRRRRNAEMAGRSVRATTPLFGAGWPERASRAIGPNPRNAAPIAQRLRLSELRCCARVLGCCSPPEQDIRLRYLGDAEPSSTRLTFAAKIIDAGTTSYRLAHAGQRRHRLG